MTRHLGWRRLATATALAGTVAIVALIVTRAPDLLAALGSCSPIAALAAIAVHAATLGCRCEAWRLSVGAIEDRRLCRFGAHAAGGAGFAAGMVQGAGTAPVRALALRRLAPLRSPPVKQLAAAELPVVLTEAAMIAIVLALAVRAIPVAPAWGGPAVLVGSVAILVALWRWAGRAQGGTAGAGLRVLRDPRRRNWMLGLLVVVTALGVLRAWLVLVGLGLPHTAAVAALAFIALGIFGLLPIGPGSTPAAMLAAAGSADPAVAIAAGLTITATSWAGVVVYASLATSAWTWRTGPRALLGLSSRASTT